MVCFFDYFYLELGTIWEVVFAASVRQRDKGTNEETVQFTHPFLGRLVVRRQLSSPALEHHTEQLNPELVYVLLQF